MFGYVVFSSSLAMAAFFVAINVVPSKNPEPSLKLALRLVRQMHDDLLWERINSLGGVCNLCRMTWLQFQELRRSPNLYRSEWCEFLLLCLRLYTVAIICNYAEVPLKATVLPGLQRRAARITDRIYTEIESQYLAAIENE